jgi:TetR/AcrR family transcriptional repressor of nem operon
MERIAHDPEVAAHVRATTTTLEDALYEVLAAARSAGELPADRNPRDLARYLVATLHGLRVLGAVNPDRTSLMAVANVAMGALG